MTNSSKLESHKAQKFLIWSSILFFSMIAGVFTAVLTGDILTGNYVIQEDPASGKTTLGVLIGLGVCTSVLPVVFVILLIWKLVKIHILEKAQKEAWLQDSILELAKRLGGKLTVIETSTELNLGVIDANNLLSQFVLLGLARLQVSDSGVLVYYFDQIISRDEKNRAESV